MSGSLRMSGSLGSMVGQRQNNAEAASRRRLSASVDAPPRRFHESLHEGQSQPGARMAGPLKGVEQASQLGAGESRPRVGDDEHGTSVALLHVNLHDPLGAGT